MQSGYGQKFILLRVVSESIQLQGSSAWPISPSKDCLQLVKSPAASMVLAVWAVVPLQIAWCLGELPGSLRQKCLIWMNCRHRPDCWKFPAVEYKRDSCFWSQKYHFTIASKKNDELFYFPDFLWQIARLLPEQSNTQAGIKHLSPNGMKSAHSQGKGTGYSHFN